MTRKTEVSLLGSGLGLLPGSLRLRTHMDSVQGARGVGELWTSEGH